jgi:hypothetical protein
LDAGSFRACGLDECSFCARRFGATGFCARNFVASRFSARGFDFPCVRLLFASRVVEDAGLLRARRLVLLPHGAALARRLE